MYAAMFDRVEAVDTLLRHGARVDTVDGDGRSAREHAEAMGATRAVHRLTGTEPPRSIAAERECSPAGTGERWVKGG